MPGILKIVSTTTDPVRAPAAAGPRYETTGSTAPGRAWRSTTTDSRRPFARAVRTKSWKRTSSMPARERRAT
jgi:hypothetical protein